MPASVTTPGPAGLDSQSTATLLEIISKLRQELLQSRSETQKATDSLNCLISLVKRAWQGETTATLHLANIVGAPVQDAGEVARFGQLNPASGKTRAVTHWERMAMKLLQREYEAVQDEIRHRQMAYLENRNKYMTEVMDSHQHDMAHYNLLLQKRAQSAQGPVQDIDKRFLRTFTKTGLNGKRPPSGSRNVRSKSAGVQPSKPKAQDIVERADMTLRELVVQPNSDMTTNSNTSNAISRLYDADPDRQTVDDRYLSTYDDPQRYTQSNLFDLNAVFGPDSMNRKARPVSAAFQRERDTRRSRPLSACTTNGDTFITQRFERPLKYETTRPVSSRDNSSKLRQRRHSGTDKQRVHSATIRQQRRDQGQRRFSFSEAESVARAKSEDPTPAQEPQTAPEAEVRTRKQPSAEQLAARARAAELQQRIDAATKPPPCVEQFDQELQEMSSLERQFRQSTLQLQKKLGIDDRGLLW
ncbi:uncharacterized protein LOC124152218 [Haliotis rufescens]|uniref:uncharacterized protein LOC124152218 n=1 Tax=Haliotis rufescens TaxID=6454 RepID=UPI001EAFA416|nr:uncharacterized protein LOC124152218 [Haliotis rufescens]